jgi:predicted TPR repeat methyltransferase
MDFAKFYNEQPDYTAFRTDEVKREEYNITVDWKARKLSQLIPAGIVFNNILEIGCAFGVLLNNIADRLSIKTRAGIDISSENIKLAKELYPDCNFISGTLEDYLKIIPAGAETSQFELIILSDIVEHLPDDLTFMKRVSEISNFVLLNLPLEKCFRNRNRQYGENDSSGHLRSYDKEMAIQLVNQAGFEIVNSVTRVAFSDKLFYKMYKGNRTFRILSKPLLLRIFWIIFYAFEDQIRLSGSNISEKIYGTNYFALLKSQVEKGNISNKS